MNPVIMLVDVPSAAREKWQAFLIGQNYDVFVAEDTKVAEEICHIQRPDLVLLHDNIPSVNAYDLCRQLKSDPLNHLTPVVLVRPEPDTFDKIRAQEACAVDYWGAPTSLWDALSRVQCLLRLRTYIDEQAKAVLLGLAHSIEEKSSLNAGHSERVAELATQLGEACGLTGETLAQLRVASLLHDIGKVGIPDEILLKPGPLNADEIRMMQQHPVIGERICAPLKVLRHISPMVRHHHERLDGSGYPDGIRGEQIPTKIRVLQIVDAYDALITDRPYRLALSPEDAFDILFTEANYGWLDLSLVRLFSSICGHENYFPINRSRSMLASYYT